MADNKISEVENTETNNIKSVTPVVENADNDSSTDSTTVDDNVDTDDLTVDEEVVEKPFRPYRNKLSGTSLPKEKEIEDN